jgi:hypothetical protein
MKRLFLVYDDKDFAEWIEEELTDYGRFIRSFESLDFFFPQWNAAGSADVIILPETVIKSEESFSKLYQTVKIESPETIFLIIYHRVKDQFIEKLLSEGNVCVSYEELDAGLLEERLRYRTAHAAAKPLSTRQKPLDKKIVNAAQPQPKAILKAETSAPVKNEQIKPDEVECSDSPISETQTSTNIDNSLVVEKELNLTETQSVPILLPLEADKPASSERIIPDTRVEQQQQERNTENYEMELETKEETTSQKRRSPEEQKAKLLRIKERIIIEEKIVTVHVPVHFNSLFVSIISLYPRAGATFVTANFARMLGENKVPVAVVEPMLENVGSTYYELMFGEKNAPKDWKSWAEQIQTKGYISQEGNWCANGVNWIPSNVEPTFNWTEEQTMQLLIAAKRFPVTICDISSNYNASQCKKIMSMSDEIWIVTDGDPIQLSHHYKTIDSLKNDYPGKQLKVIGNKWNSYIKQSEWKEAVLLPILTQIPDLGPIVLKHLWDGKMAWDDSKLKNTLTSPFKPMARAVMAKEMYSLMKKQYGLRAKLSGFFKQMKSLDDEAKSRKF